jgi:antitoxin YefM
MRYHPRESGLTGGPKVVILMVMSETMPLAKVKAHLSEVVDRVTASHERISITRHGHREAVVIAADDLDALEDTLDLLSDPAAVREIAEARQAAARGEGLDIAAVRRRYLAHGA